MGGPHLLQSALYFKSRLLMLLKAMSAAACVSLTVRVFYRST